jgi:glyoxylase-like metal-dependent hydrolase (beta-lactamase superfamily II)
LLTGARIVAHPDDAEIIAGKKERPMVKSGFGVFFSLFRTLMKVRPFQVDLLAHEGDDIAGLKVIHIPGHTPGSIALYDRKRKVLFVGDALRFRNEAVQGPSERMTMDLNKAYESIEKLTSFDFDVLLSGHSKPVLSNATTKVQEFLERRKK